MWVGIELHSRLGKHEGTVKGKEHFRCKPTHGVFVRRSRITKALDSSQRSNSSTAQAQASMNINKRKSAVLRDSSAAKPGVKAAYLSGDQAASAFSRKQEIRKSWIKSIICTYYTILVWEQIC
ncbi:CAP-Gly domain-containing linker protein 3-like [Xenopus laevis]|uniref:CAP-Gly domain-containing linker protein 3-like n=1 Tax=Xenopus laevis TaxID=8355 RepID=A0A8J1LPR0_XENLA|nr:CAP-Gly domain-containing linker protein 3-like [Xenopus laevis]